MEAVVGQGSQGSRRGWLKPLGIVVVVLLVVALIVGVALLAQAHNKQEQQTKQVNAAIAASQVAYNRGDFTNAFNLVRGKADLATSNEQKAKVYQAAAQAASGANRLSLAAQYYELKHKADPSTAAPDAYILGTIYERLGQNTKALAQYKIALAYSKTRSNQYGNDSAAIQASIDELEGK